MILRPNTILNINLHPITQKKERMARKGGIHMAYCAAKNLYTGSGTTIG